ncbi:MAG: 30S ribosomal protein S17e [Aigarchaeota archaeon]|nr:30S ribosomal protein S17e [Aigarchaeota archaeon]MDH5703227.1 30S ribosomal protein S17e [Aigarchaeota archaeon]
MGKVRTSRVKRVARQVLSIHGASASTDFQQNKQLVESVLKGNISKSFVNKVAGYITSLQTSGVRRAEEERGTGLNLSASSQPRDDEY